jgi:hypothetical protein
MSQPEAVKDNPRHARSAQRQHRLSLKGRARARSGEDSRRGAKAGVSIHGAKLFFCIRLVMESFADGQPSLLLRVRRESVPGSVDVLACGELEAAAT